MTDSEGPTAVVGDIFFDPQGTYTISINDDWEDISGTVVKEIEQWAVDPTPGDFAANVNVLTQDAGGRDLASYMEFSTQNMGGLELIDHSTIVGANGNELGLLEYKGIVPGADRPLHFLATVDVRDGQAVVATFTAKEADFERLRPNVEPYLKTLQAT